MCIRDRTGPVRVTLLPQTSLTSGVCGSLLFLILRPNFRLVCGSAQPLQGKSEEAIAVADANN
eukprot:502992-Alexandrium_andersonii.AAC.1